MSDLMNMREATAFTGYNKKTLGRYVKDGKLHPVVEGKRYLFHRGELIELLPPMAREALKQTQTTPTTTTSQIPDLISFLEGLTAYLRTNQGIKHTEGSADSEVPQGENPTKARDMEPAL